MTAEVSATPEVFALKTAMVADGQIHNVVAQSDLLQIVVKVYASGGENYVHTHPNEDHAFILLEGEATFRDRVGGTTVLRKHQGILMPRGAFYQFTNTGSEPLVMLRVGANIAPGEYRTERLFPPGVSDPRTAADPAVTIPGRFFGDPDRA